MNSLICPNCGSEHIRSKNLARKTGGTLGVLAGGASGIAGALRGARLGMVAGAVAGPVGIALGSITGAAVGGILGAALGCEVGASLGGLVDSHLLDNYVCLDCGHAFGKNGSPEPGPLVTTILRLGDAVPGPSGEPDASPA